MPVAVFLKAYFFSLVGLFVAAGVGLGYFLWRFDPYVITAGQWFVFYGIVFVFTFCLSTLLGYSLRVWLFRNNPLRFFAKVSARQGALVSVLVVLMLYLQSLRSLTLLGMLLLILSLTLLEMAFLSRA